MQHACDPGLMRLLRQGVEQGLWTMDVLDRPTHGWQEAAAVPPRGPFHGKDICRPYRNLLREPLPAPEAVQVTSERDLPVLPHGHTPAQELDLPVTLEEPDPCPF